MVLRGVWGVLIRLYLVFYLFLLVRTLDLVVLNG